jgi:peptidoglycan/LPS O-acetylase OafA/YrhL
LSAIRLSDAIDGRDNNFNLIRILAALAVLLSHSYALVRGPGTPDMFSETLGMTLGEIAVDVFFITSGFLVTSSLLNRQSTLEFLWARFLRIFPGLWVMLLLAVFLLGPAFTTVPLSEYFAAKATYSYLAKCGTLISGVTYELPGVFVGNALPNAVNGSLWTMPLELKMYLILAALWTSLLLIRSRRGLVFRTLIATFAVASMIFVIADHFWLHASRQFGHFFYMFFIGAGAYVSRSRILLTRTAFLMLAAAAIVCSLNKNAFFIAYTCLLPYIVLYCAYVPTGAIRSYNRLGDYSYGVYIYAFPVQQTVVAVVPNISIGQLDLIAGAATIALAAASWHLIEAHALSLKKLAGRQIGAVVAS